MDNVAFRQLEVLLDSGFSCYKLRHIIMTDAQGGGKFVPQNWQMTCRVDTIDVLDPELVLERWR